MNRQWSSIKHFLTAILAGLIIGSFYQNGIPDAENCSRNVDSTIEPKIEMPAVEPVVSQGFIYVGVMTTIQNLASRGRALWDSWGTDFRGSIEFYVGGRNISDENREILTKMQPILPIHVLWNVDDLVYPPQKKSFYMVNNMIRTKLTDYKWFLRSDDDLFVDTGRLEVFLKQLNETKPHVIGSPGEGDTLDFLEHNEMYCMGGPGIILSRALLQKLEDKLPKCLTRLRTNHEDVELTRCIRHITGKSCGNRYSLVLNLPRIRFKLRSKYAVC